MCVRIYIYLSVSGLCDCVVVTEGREQGWEGRGKQKRTSVCGACVWEGVGRVAEEKSEEFFGHTHINIVIINIHIRTCIRAYRYKHTVTHVTAARRVTGWRTCTGCRKLQVSFRKIATNFRALLRKMNCKYKASDTSSPPSVGVAIVCRLPC